MEKKKRRSSARRLLPPDLTVELLLRLPAKSLSRFRCVCKSWYTLFSDPIFGKRHRARYLPNPALLTSSSSVDKGNNINFHVSSFDSEGTLVRHFAKRCLCRYLFVLSTCRDLLLTSSFVFNITTQEVVITLPPSYLALALGHVPSTDEYKVFALEIHLEQRYKVLTLGTDQWRDVDAPPSSVHLCATFANGAFHVTRGNDYIESFNLEQEEWGVLAPPPLTRPNYHLRELSGYLCMVDVVDANNHVDIWLLKDYDKGLWVKEYTICLSTVKARRYWPAVNPLLIEDDGRLVVQVNGYSLQLYDPKTQCSREIQHFEKIVGANSFHVKCFSSLGHRMHRI